MIYPTGLYQATEKWGEMGGAMDRFESIGNRVVVMKDHHTGKDGIPKFMTDTGHNVVNDHHR
jgi:hypothetical protein